MALTKVQKTGITDNAIDADKIEDGTIVAADIAPGTITDAKLASTLDLSSKTVTLPNTSVTNDMLAGSIANDKLANSSITVNGSSVSLGGSVSAGKVQWQAVKTADFNAVAGEGYFVDTNSVGAVTATLPGSPSAGDTIAFKDYAGTFGTNSLTIARNGNNIQGVANDSEISTNRASIVLVYIDATKGWLYTNESNVADLQANSFIGATGGTILTNGDYKTHVFTGDGCFVVSTIGGGPAGGPGNVDYLIVAGGGGGAWGGGGAGGYRTSFPSPDCNAGAFPISATTYPITVGGGGLGAQPVVYKGTPGSPSIFSTITSSGGGTGALPSPPGGSADSGGSGGGTGAPGGTGGAGNTPPVSPPQGNPGGNSANSQAGGGGGGAGAAGVSQPSPVGFGRAGGVGLPIATDFFGPTAPSYGTPGPAPGRYFSGGGGGHGNPTVPGVTPGSGGAGGGGNGFGFPSVLATTGTANTGGGGGATNLCNPALGNGGKGIVVIRYKFQ